MAQTRHSTIIIVPHARGKVYKIHVSPLVLRAVVAVAVVTNQRLTETVSQVQARLTQFEQRTKALAMAAGIPDLLAGSTEAPHSGAGSGGPLERLTAEPETLVKRQQQIDMQLEKVEHKLTEQAVMLSHTPVLAPKTLR